ncbi:hypothetical protein Y032_0002g621 [Ancylostoma ceylanicum]|uniref:Uncharacterized protein n=1 Tax=Ancylostoma ceylanicum TaxID=53326 RepID=A0A016W0G8_9BILA|nr:hypothetical protein Y032_0002g621 [Ancylostoma ceylanicum]
MGGISLCRREGARKAKKDKNEGGRCRIRPAPTRGDNAMQRVHYCGSGTKATKASFLKGSKWLKFGVGRWIAPSCAGCPRGCNVSKRVLACPIDKINDFTRQFGSANCYRLRPGKVIPPVLKTILIQFVYTAGISVPSRC